MVLIPNRSLDATSRYWLMKLLYYNMLSIAHSFIYGQSPNSPTIEEEAVEQIHLLLVVPISYFIPQVR